MSQLTDPPYMQFPLQIGAQGAVLADGPSHVRQQIEQVLFTGANERVFRPNFGAGLKQLIFEPNSSALWEVARKRLSASLADALAGVVDPKTLAVDVTGDGEKLLITITYTLAAIGRSEKQQFLV